MVQWAFDTLGIAVTTDKRSIKKAYSALVKEHHPEEQPDEWSKIHEAYKEAMEYADNFAEKVSLVENQNLEEEILFEDDYNEVFEDVYEKWEEERSEKELALARRLKELFEVPEASAEMEWLNFFADEFLLSAGANELFMLFEAVCRNEIPVKAAKLIASVLIKRKEFYQDSMEFQKAALANDIVNCIYEKLPKVEESVRRKKKGFKGILKQLLAGMAAGVFIIVVLVLVTAEEGIRQGKIREEAVRQLNKKYGRDLYSKEDIEVERDKPVEGRESFSFWRVTEKDSYEMIAYLLGDEEKEEEFLCFDMLQTSELRQALEKEVNERTGRMEGRLYWDSEGRGSGCIKDGYFHEKYEGNLSEFLKLEAKVRREISGEDHAAGDALAGENGNIDYYVPDEKIWTLKQRMELKRTAVDDGFLAALEQCAEDYEIQIRGIVLPGLLFEEKMKQADGNERSISVGWDIHSLSLYPPLPSSMMTGWYVCIPKKDQEYVKIQNGMYLEDLIEMAEGIWGSKIRIRIQEGQPEGENALEMSGETDLTGCMKKIKTPDTSKIHKSAGQTAVSFCLADGYKLEEDCCLAIDKEICKIPDKGYRVQITQYGSEGEETTECTPVSYSRLGTDIRYGDVLDGEDYLFVEYPGAGEDEKAAVLTILY